MTDILKSFNVLQNELNVAKTNLKGVDENIKRLLGRYPSELSFKRNVNNQNEERVQRPSRGNLIKNEETSRRFRRNRNLTFPDTNDEIHPKRRTNSSSGGNISVFKRLSERPIKDEPPLKQFKGITSKVIVTPKEIPSRQERLDAQSKDVTSVARNKRMFGALLGTLQKFQQEETKLKTKEKKRAQVEKKIEEHEIQEKEESKKAKRELFISRKKKQAEIKMIERKMIRMEEYATWEKSQLNRMNFIKTKAKPHIHYLPRKLNEAQKTILEQSKKEIQEIIDKKREQVQEEFLQIEERGKWSFEQKKQQQNAMKNEEKHDEHDDEQDEDELDEEKQQIDNLKTENEGQETSIDSPIENTENNENVMKTEVTNSSQQSNIVVVVNNNNNNANCTNGVNESTLDVDITEN